MIAKLVRDSARRTFATQQRRTLASGHAAPAGDVPAANVNFWQQVAIANGLAFTVAGMWLYWTRSNQAVVDDFFKRVEESKKKA